MPIAVDLRNTLFMGQKVTTGVLQDWKLFVCFVLFVDRFCPWEKRSTNHTNYTNYTKGASGFAT